MIIFHFFRFHIVGLYLTSTFAKLLSFLSDQPAIMAARGLLDLPAEIKDKIWREVFRGSTVALYASDISQRYRIGLEAFSAELLTTCKQINLEARPMLASSTHITLADTDFSRMKSATCRYYFSLTRTLNLSGWKYPPHKIPAFKSLRVVELCSETLSIDAVVSGSCDRKKIDSYMEGHNDAFLVKMSIHALEGHDTMHWVLNSPARVWRSFEVVLGMTLYVAECPGKEAENVVSTAKSVS